MPFPIAAVISAVVSAYAANEASKSAAAQSAADAANRPKFEFEPMKPVSLEDLSIPGSEHKPGSGDDDPFAGEIGGAFLPPGESVINTDPTPIEGTPMSQIPVDPASAWGRSLEDLNQPIEQDLDPNLFDPSKEKPPTGSGEEGFMGMNGMELAMLGLTLGSMLSQRKPGPPPPALPGNSFSPMRPVFRG